MRKLTLLVVAIVGVGLGYLATHDPPSVTSSESVQQVATRVCKVSAGPTKRDQEDCVSKYVLNAAVSGFQKQDDAKLNAARR